MSISNVRPYFRAKLDTLGFQEWRDAFNLSNIPNTILDKSYHILTPEFIGGPINHTHQNVDTRVVLSFFIKGYKYPADAVDEAVLNVEVIADSICKVVDRTSTLLNVVFEGADLNPINIDNDNSVLVEMRFTARVVLGVR